MLRGGTFDSQWSKEGKVFSLLYCLSRLCFFSLGSLPTCKGCSNTLWRETSNPQYGSTEVTKIFIGIVIVLILIKVGNFMSCVREDFNRQWYPLRAVLIVLGVGKVQSTKLLNGRDFIWRRKVNLIKEEQKSEVSPLMSQIKFPWIHFMFFRSAFETWKKNSTVEKEQKRNKIIGDRFFAKAILFKVSERSKQSCSIRAFSRSINHPVIHSDSQLRVVSSSVT